MLLFRRHLYHTWDISMGFQQVILSKVYFCISLAVNIILQTWTHKPFTPADPVWKKDSDLNAKNATGFSYPIWPFDPWIFRLPSLKEILMSVCLLLPPDWVWTPSCWQRSSTCPLVVAGPATHTIQSQVFWRESPQPTTTRAALEPH